MKKILSLILVLAILCSFSVCAFASDGTTTSGSILDKPFGEVIGDIGNQLKPKPGLLDNFLEDFLGVIQPAGGPSLGQLTGQLAKGILGKYVPFRM